MQNGGETMVDNICAIATAFGNAAISIIRCSGPNAVELVDRVFKGKRLTNCESHTIHHGYITDENQIIDEVVCNVFLSPHSFDGENMVEINCHGGTFVTDRVLKVLLRNGFRLAENGEFSKRAFLNRKLDLTQAEAIMDLISASNALAVESSANALRKSTYRLVGNLRNKILDILAKIEVNIDYPEYEDSPEVTHRFLEPILMEILRDMKQILDNSKLSTIVIHGIKTAIIGKPNVGKSSLLNLLLDEDKAIVSSVAGTTRDIVEGTIQIQNMTLKLLDTAGIRSSKDDIETIGIKKSEKALESADLVLLVLDCSKTLEEEDYILLEKTKNKKRIIIANKSDLPNMWQREDAVSISCKEEFGIEEIGKKIYDIMHISDFHIEEGKYLNNQRQIHLMNQAYESLIHAKQALEEKIDIDLIEIDIKEAFDLLGQITGEAHSDELVTALFTKFCLGK